MPGVDDLHIWLLSAIHVNPYIRVLEQRSSECCSGPCQQGDRPKQQERQGIHSIRTVPEGTLVDERQIAVLLPEVVTPECAGNTEIPLNGPCRVYNRNEQQAAKHDFNPANPTERELIGEPQC